MKHLTIIAGRTLDNVIGIGNHLPWKVKPYSEDEYIQAVAKKDMNFFKKTTKGYPVLMGYNTWDSIPEKFRPLPKRQNIVLTKNHADEVQGADIAGSFDEAIELMTSETGFVMGGVGPYGKALEHPACNRMLLSRIPLQTESYDRNVYFPEIPKEWDLAGTHQLDGLEVEEYRK